jgi:hypothetical protein
MSRHNPFWPKHAFLFKGGSPAPAIASAPVPIAAPPVTGTSAEVIQAQQDYASQNLLKKSVKKTIYAGDTGGGMKKPGAAGAVGSMGVGSGGVGSGKKLG